MIQRVILIILCLGSVYVSTGQAKKRKAPKQVVLFTLNKKPVLADEFIYLYKKNHQLRPEEYSKEDVLGYLRLFINFKLKVEEARQRGMDTTAAFLTEYKSYRNELIKPYLPDTRIVDSLLLLTYSRLKEEIRASHILISAKQDASPEDTLIAYNRIMSLKRRIESGEDFGNIAAAHSEDPTARNNQGDLGFFTALQMVYPFEHLAYHTQVGETSGPVRTQFGYHLIKVTDRQPARGEIEVSHIMIRTGSSKDEEGSKNVIFDIYNQLMAGASWDELCREHSQDQSSKDNGGRLRPFGVGAMSSVPEFEKVAFSLQDPGDISDPFRSAFGWHIVRLERKKPLPAYEDLAPQLKSRVTKDDRLKVSKEVWKAKFLKQYNFTENIPAKTKALAPVDSSLADGKGIATSTPHEKEVLFTLEGEPYSYERFTTYVQKNQRPGNESQDALMDKFYTAFVESVLQERIEEQIAREHPEFSMLANEYYEGILLFEIMEKEIWDKAAGDSLGQLGYFNRNKENYIAGERIKATFYSSSDSSFQARLRTLIRQADSVAINAFLAKNKVRHETGRYEKSDRMIVEKIAWSPGVYAAQSNGMYYLVSVHDIIPPGKKSFEEARASVISDYQQELEKNWIEVLQKKYPVKVNEKGKQYALDKIRK